LSTVCKKFEKPHLRRGRFHKKGRVLNSEVGSCGGRSGANAGSFLRLEKLSSKEKKRGDEKGSGTKDEGPASQGEGAIIKQRKVREILNGLKKPRARPLNDLKSGEEGCSEPYGEGPYFRAR